ncbi:hypothetical protein [Novosphingobium sp. TH158]|uniref:hypothetical protein n=1 Tax=Novosphingobium sp. TH158 TaxID=2067455 RepID=UPI000C7C469E|nr:hypothetical protein [Novosphingobium sp. TH158]PLK27536.1 hypothetical protein C0V78_12040 [Novosphingobium sp. TH158]
MRGAGALRAGLAVAALMALQGCVAAAIPVIAGAAITKTQVDGESGKPDASVPPKEVRKAVFVGEEPPKASLAPTVVTSPVAVEPAQAGPRIYTVTEQQPPAPASAPAPATTVSKAAYATPAPVSIAPQVLGPAPRPIDPAPAAKPAEAPRSAAPVIAAAAPTAELVPSAPKPPMGKSAMLPPAPEAIPVTGKSSGYLGLTSYALSRVNSPQADAVLDVIDANDPLSSPRRAQCGKLQPAVMIDLDPGLDVFNPAAAAPQPGLAEALSAMRAAGITVLWSSALPVEQAEQVASALARTGLDPSKTDRLLLLKGPGDRKQARRLSAARNWCVLAMAGDRRGDFDEAFDYLKDAEATIPADRLFGNGWFIAPAPLP